MSRIHLRPIVAILAVALLSWGCNKETPVPSPPPAKKAPAPKATPVQPGGKTVAEIAPPKYIYSGAGRRDPFENPLKEVAAPQMGNQEALTPLQKIDLRQLRIIGIIIGRGEPAAMVVGPGGKSYILKKGVKVGKNDGVVLRIDTEKVTIREKYYDFSGALRTSIQELELPKRGGAK